jgi:OmpA family protein/putative peptidoglycan binding protein
MGASDDSTLDGDLAGIAASHPPGEIHPLILAPSTGKEFNTLRKSLFPIACWRLDDVRFEFDSSFIKPEVSRELRELAGLRQMHKGALLSVFGHADPVGDDNYNKQLSGRRAMTIYGLLTRDVPMWEKLYAPPVGGDNWGVKSVQVMLLTLGHDPGAIDGVMGPETSKAIREFEGTPAGQNTAAMRKKLFAAYMEKICVDEFGKSFKLTKTDFLAQGKDPAGKGDFQGCSEFNPVLMFSKAQNTDFQKPANHKARNAANTPNRRVVVLLFRADSVVDPKKWPCPAATAGIADCQARFWSDAPKRRTFQEKKREFEKTKDTFACRFYQRLVEQSPCERTIQYWVLRILKSGPELVPDRKPLADTPFELSGVGGTKPVVTGRTDANGILRVQVFSEVTDMTLKIAGAQILIEAGKLLPAEGGEEPCKRRLCNLGYGPADVRKWKPEETKAAFEKFQTDFKLTKSGTADGPTQAKLKELHGS